MIYSIPTSKIVKTDIDPEIHKTPDALKLKESCQQFEAILWTKLWKDMQKTARSISGSDKGRPYQQMEELTLEMATDDLVTSSGGAGLWKMLYDSMIGKLAADQEAEARMKADQEAASFEDIPESQGFDVQG
ncbi:MAG: hypothetical protein IJQ15_05435 [Synergistaceae bacterium]|nr:hypothetical protein [Synergistaceae bacterium]MBQ3760010.1 hypothetical protein [Synergistaceae bacterium]MBQ4402372.1 hypothetical protein [Synergistaceae bacterium]MBQ6114101.1 hypothetical protein [Synergistaceae bacterium]MBQ6419048.1 hypothetical protein [Synergistaceae bacterium]